MYELAGQAGVTRFFFFFQPLAYVYSTVLYSFAIFGLRFKFAVFGDLNTAARV